MPNSERLQVFWKTNTHLCPDCIISHHTLNAHLQPLDSAMSRPAKLTLAASVLVSGLTVWGVHYMQEREREVMYRGVERDEARQEEKRRKRLLDLELNQAREAEYQKVQPTARSKTE